jgi:hypothetical protein
VPRTRYRWDAAEQKLVEVGADYTPPARHQINSDRHYENLALTDGTIINSRRQHRAYMKAKGLTLADDFKGVWAKQAEERKRVTEGTHDREARREALGRAAFEKGLL